MKTIKALKLSGLVIAQVNRISFVYFKVSWACVSRAGGWTAVFILY